MRNYADVPLGPPASPLEAPEAGTGVVFVQQDPEGTWSASWQADDRLTDIEGVGEAAATAWAKSRQADSVMVFSPERDEYVAV